MSVKVSFLSYITTSKVQASKKAASAWYDEIVVNERVRKTSEKNPRQASGQRLSVHCLLVQEARETSPNEYNQTRELLKSLMRSLYYKERFYQDLLEKRPHFLDDILNEIERAVERSPTQKVKSPEGLLNLVFEADDLHYAFYLMMRGKPTPKSIHEKETVSLPVVSNHEVADNEEIEESSKDEGHAEAGYVALIDFITVRSQVKKVRVFLAPPELLMAIYGDDVMVSRILEMRTELSREARRKKGRPLSELTEQFKSSFENAGRAPTFSEILDFTVTKTKPKNNFHQDKK